MDTIEKQSTFFILWLEIALLILLFCSKLFFAGIAEASNILIYFVGKAKV